VSTLQAFKVTRGDTLKAGRVVFTLMDGGAAQNLAGATVRFKRRHRTATVGITQETRAMTVTDAAAGQCTVAYTAAETALLPIGEHVCQVEVMFSDGTVSSYPDAGDAPLLMTVFEGL
jgi:hypothetical protein